MRDRASEAICWLFLAAVVAILIMLALGLAFSFNDARTHGYPTATPGRGMECIYVPMAGNPSILLPYCR